MADGVGPYWSGWAYGPTGLRAYGPTGLRAYPCGGPCGPLLVRPGLRAYGALAWRARRTLQALQGPAAGDPAQGHTNGPYWSYTPTGRRAGVRT